MKKHAMQNQIRLLKVNEYEVEGKEKKKLTL